VRHFGKEDLLKLYDNCFMDDFLAQIASITHKDVKTISVKVVEDTVIRRIDRKVYNQDNPNLKNRIKDLKIVDNSAILVEEKSKEELEEAAEDEIKLHKLTSQDERVDIDSTENIRTVIVNPESEPSNFERYQINIDWTV
jgi:hypothetical protein